MTRNSRARGSARAIGWREAVVLAALTYLPLSLQNIGILSADTKQYLYLDPGDLLARSMRLWDSRVGGGTVTHQAIGYLWPMGPYYWLADKLGLPDWLAQRWWIASIQFAAGLGTLLALRYLCGRQRFQLIGAIAYSLSPFLLGHVTGQSALLLPFAALGWLVWATARAIETPSWRYPAIFALIVTTAGALNGSSIFFVIAGASALVPYAWLWERRITARRGLGVLARTGLLVVATQLWWLMAYAIGGRYGLPILSLTETVQTTNGTTSSPEIIRGLGYWFFYGGDSRLWLDGITNRYLESPRFIAVTFAVPVLAIAATAMVRVRARGYFVFLLIAGTVVGAGAFATPDRSPAGGAFERLSRRSDLVLSLRNTQRAAPLVVFALAGLLTAGLSALHRRHARPALAVAAVALLSALASLPNHWTDGLVASRFSRPEALPAAWIDAAEYIDRSPGRVLEIPGIDFGAYRWGHTLDPVLTGLTDQPVVNRELIPIGGLPGASLLIAFDRSIQEGWFEPSTVAPVARLLGANRVLVRNDLEYERYRTVRPDVLWTALSNPSAGLGDPAVFNEAYVNRAAAHRPMIDEIELAQRERTIPPQIAVFTLGEPVRLLRAEPLDAVTVVAGDGEGVLAAAAAGLLGDERTPLFLSADLADARFALPAGAQVRHVITDSNRKRTQRWYSLRENAGATEPIDAGVSLVDDPNSRLSTRPVTGPGTQTTVEFRGASAIWANAYGSPFTLTPEDRPVNAFDGDARTAWRVDTEAYRAPQVSLPHRIGVDLGRQVPAREITLVQPQRRAGTRAVTNVRVRLDRTREFDVPIDERTALDPAGIRVALDGAPFQVLEVEIIDVAPDPGPAGFAEITIPGVSIDEIVQLPVGAFALSGAPLADSSVAVVFSRQRANPAEPVRADPEPRLLRGFDLPSAARFELSGTVRVAAGATDDAVDRLIGHLGVTARSSEHLPGDLRSRASAAFDGDRTTAWQTPFVGLTGQRVTAELDRPVRLSGFDIDVVNDERHSVPTKLAVRVNDSTPTVVEVPAAPPGPTGTTQRVRAELAAPTELRSIAIEIVAVEERTTIDWYSNRPVALPVGVAEIGIPTAASSRGSTAVDTGCRDDLLRLDGQPVSVRVRGSAADALARNGLELTLCAGPLELAAGRHDLRTAAGLDTALDVDRIVLRTPGFAREPATATAPPVTMTASSPTSAGGRVTTDGQPFLVVLDQSYNRGWRLSVDGARVSPAIAVDSFANGWLVEPSGPGELEIRARWAPQRLATIALAFSALACALCLALATLSRPRPDEPQRDDDREPEFTDPRRPIAGRPVVAVALAAGAATAIFVAPIAAPFALALVLAAGRAPWGAAGARMLPPLAIVTAIMSIPLRQLTQGYVADAHWPGHFGTTHLVVMTALIAMGAIAYLDDAAPRARSRSRKRPADRPA